MWIFHILLCVSSSTVSTNHRPSCSISFSFFMCYMSLLDYFKNVVIVVCLSHWYLLSHVGVSKLNTKHIILRGITVVGLIDYSCMMVCWRICCLSLSIISHTYSPHRFSKICCSFVFNIHFVLTLMTESCFVIFPLNF